MHAFSRYASLVAILGLSPLVAGCGGEPGSDRETHTVQGVVTYKDAPVAEGTVLFEAPSTGLGGRAELSEEAPTPRRSRQATTW
ncbi:MAG: hypothetical protein R3B90_01575 [Planctomycetaceae bacterium]